MDREAGGLQYMSHRRAGHDMATKQQLLNGSFFWERGSCIALVSQLTPALLPAGCAVCEASRRHYREQSDDLRALSPSLCP